MITKKNVNMKALGAAANFSIEENLFLKVATDPLYDGKRPEEVFEDLVNGFVDHLTLLNSVKPFTLNKGSYAGYSRRGLRIYADYCNGVFSIVCVSNYERIYSA